jgi:hypothetical protein
MTVHNKLDLAAPEVRDFWNARDEAKFLFGPTVIAGLDEIEIKLRKMFVAANRQNPTDAIEQELNELRGWFMLRPSSLPELFAEMKLVSPPQPTSTRRRVMGVAWISHWPSRFT